jgi:hypothetical protein
MIVSLVSEPQERLERLVDAVMAVPTRYRSVLARFGDLDEIDATLRDRGAPTSWSALEHIHHVADALHSWAKEVVAVADDDAPHRHSLPMDVPRTGSNGAPSRVVLAALHAAATDLSRAASSVALERSRARAAGEELVAKVSEMLEDALDEAESHLAEVDAVLGIAVRRRLQPA